MAVKMEDIEHRYNQGQTDLMLYCEECGAQRSANPGDYWYLPHDHVFRCGHGITNMDHAQEPMVLAREIRRMEVILR